MPRNVNHIAKLPAIQRLPNYLRALKEMNRRGREYVSAAHLAGLMGLVPIVVSKDLALTGVQGKPRVGYAVPSLIECIERFLGWNNTRDAFLVGAGHLGGALLGYSGFEDNGMRIVAAFDVAPEKVGSEIYGKKIFHLDRLREMAKRMKIHMGILTVPARMAQEALDQMVAAGIWGIWNFTAANLDAPENVVVQNQDLSAGLAVLSTRMKDARKSGGATKRPSSRRLRAKKPPAEK